uniref:Uncharacterized protein n=1 Tax=Steinernema glaseri TaxID=37863 RepID=A0A1I7Z5S1_9BILA
MNKCAHNDITTPRAPIRYHLIGLHFQLVILQENQERFDGSSSASVARLDGLLLVRFTSQCNGGSHTTSKLCSSFCEPTHPLGKLLFQVKQAKVLRRSSICKEIFSKEVAHVVIALRANEIQK